MPVVDLGRYGLVRRDCPNVILPVLAPSAARTLQAAAWTWPASKAQIIPATGAGSIAYEFLLDQLIVQALLGKDLFTNTSTYFRTRMHLRVATGAAPGTVVAEAQLATSAFVSLDGIVDDAVGAAVYATGSQGIPCGPVRIPANTRISYDAAIDTANLDMRSARAYASGYNLSTFDFTKVSAYDELYQRGMRPIYPDVNPLASQVAVTAGVTGWQISDAPYAQATASLDEDYLIWGAASVDTDVPVSDSYEAQFDVSLGAAGSEVVQSRWGMPFASIYHNATWVDWLLPFIAYKGERLAIRCASASSSNVYSVSIYGVRLT